MCVVCLSIHWPHSLGYNFVADGDDIVEGAEGIGARGVTPLAGNGAVYYTVCYTTYFLSLLSSEPVKHKEY